MSTVYKKVGVIALDISTNDKARNQQGIKHDPHQQVSHKSGAYVSLPPTHNIEETAELLISRGANGHLKKKSDSTVKHHVVINLIHFTSIYWHITEICSPTELEVSPGSLVSGGSQSHLTNTVAQPSIMALMHFLLGQSAEQLCNKSDLSSREKATTVSHHAACCLAHQVGHFASRESTQRLGQITLDGNRPLFKFKVCIKVLLYLPPTLNIPPHLQLLFCYKLKKNVASFRQFSI